MSTPSTAIIDLDEARRTVSAPVRAEQRLLSGRASEALAFALRRAASP